MFFRAPPPPPPPAYRGPPADVAYVFAAIAFTLLLLVAVQTRPLTATPRWLPEVGTEKREYEVWILQYSVVWMGAFALIIASGIYESFDALAYFIVLGGLAAPLLLQPLFFRGEKGRSQAPSIGAQHAARAQVWIFIFGFIGNYWYTHYFYCLLKAKYTMPAWRLNDVPIAMFAATHFYFASYHVFANLPIRYVRTAFQEGALRLTLEIALILAMSYATAFMETLTISNFPYYDFENRDYAYTVGSAIYGLYFIVSFPAYFALDEPGKVVGAWHRSVTPLRDAAASALASGMLVLIFLDLVRLIVVAVPFTMGGKLWEVTYN